MLLKYDQNYNLEVINSDKKGKSMNYDLLFKEISIIYKYNVNFILYVIDFERLIIGYTVCAVK